MGLAFVCNVLAARLLGAGQFGQFTFVQSFLAYFGLFFEFGVSIAAGRLLALSRDREQRADLCGAWLVVFSFIAMAYVVIIALASQCVDQIFHLGVRSALVVCIVPAVGMPLQTALREILQGRGSMLLLGILNILPWACFLVGLGVLGLRGMNSVVSVALAYFTSLFATTVAISIALRPQFHHLKEQVSRILAETRSFGVHVFLARVVGVGTFQLDSPMIAYFTQDATAVGFYGLAKGIVAPISMLSRSLGIVLFPDLATSMRLPAKLVRANLLWLISACGTLCLLAKPLITVFFSAEYMDMLPMLYVWTAIAFIQGAFQLPNLFLNAQGQGRTLRNMAIWYAIANVVLNISLIPLLGAMGASIASGGAYSLWLMLCILYYRHTTSEAYPS